MQKDIIQDSISQFKDFMEQKIKLRKKNEQKDIFDNLQRRLFILKFIVDYQKKTNVIVEKKVVQQIYTKLDIVIDELIKQYPKKRLFVEDNNIIEHKTNTKVYIREKKNKNTTHSIFNFFGSKKKRRRGVIRKIASVIGTIFKVIFNPGWAIQKSFEFAINAFKASVKFLARKLFVEPYEKFKQKMHLQVQKVKNYIKEIPVIKATTDWVEKIKRNRKWNKFEKERKKKNFLRLEEALKYAEKYKKQTGQNVRIENLGSVEELYQYEKQRKKSESLIDKLKRNTTNVLGWIFENVPFKKIFTPLILLMLAAGAFIMTGPEKIFKLVQSAFDGGKEFVSEKLNVISKRNEQRKQDIVSHQTSTRNESSNLATIITAEGESIGMPLPKILVTSTFGYRPNVGAGDYHKGIDLRAYYTNVYSSTDGKVVAVGYQPGAAGNYVKIESIIGGKKYHFFYAHLEKPLVQSGQTVKHGDIIAISGNTGGSLYPHLHYEIRKEMRPGQFEAIEPGSFLKSIGFTPEDFKYKTKSIGEQFNMGEIQSGELKPDDIKYIKGNYEVQLHKSKRKPNVASNKQYESTQIINRNKTADRLREIGNETVLLQETENPNLVASVKKIKNNLIVDEINQNDESFSFFVNGMKNDSSSIANKLKENYMNNFNSKDYIAV